MVGGLKGEFLPGWKYDACASYYYTSLYQSNDGYLSISRIQNALLVDPATGNCIPGGACVPYNPGRRTASPRRPGLSELVGLAVRLDHPAHC